MTTKCRVLRERGGIIAAYDGTVQISLINEVSEFRDSTPGRPTCRANII